MVTPKQIAALKYLIAKSRDGSEMAKRVIFLLIDQSQGLAEEVSVTFTQDKDGYTQEEISNVAHAVGALSSSNGSTYMDELMKLMGAKLTFSLHYGHYDESGKYSTEGQFGERPQNAPGHENDRKMPVRYTFWLSMNDYGHDGHVRPVTPPTREELMAIELNHSLLSSLLYG